jgi:glutathione S-transferase
LPEIRLYGIPLSHPTLAARGMLERKGLSYRYVSLLGGMHPPALWAHGFRGATVPALRLADGRRIQGSLQIAQALEELAPSPSLYPANPVLRPAALKAERWGESVLQPVPRRLIRWGLNHHLSQRRWFAEVATPFPAPDLMGIALTPLVPLFVAQAGARGPRVQRDLAELSGLLDHVDDLLTRGVIGCAELGAADFQIGTSLRMLLAMRDVGAAFTGRPAEAFARRVLPDYPEIPPVFPAEWLATR